MVSMLLGLLISAYSSAHVSAVAQMRKGSNLSIHVGSDADRKREVITAQSIAVNTAGEHIRKGNTIQSIGVDSADNRWTMRQQKQ